MLWAFFLLFLAVAFYNAGIQKIPNFSYRILPTGQWQITDKQHETLTPDTAQPSMPTAHQLKGFAHWLTYCAKYCCLLHSPTRC